MSAGLAGFVSLSLSLSLSFAFSVFLCPSIYPLTPPTFPRSDNEKLLQEQLQMLTSDLDEKDVEQLQEEVNLQDVYGTDTGKRYIFKDIAILGPPHIVGDVALLTGKTLVSPFAGHCLGSPKPAAKRLTPFHQQQAYSCVCIEPCDILEISKGDFLHHTPKRLFAVMQKLALEKIDHRERRIRTLTDFQLGKESAPPMVDGREASASATAPSPSPIPAAQTLQQEAKSTRGPKPVPSFSGERGAEAEAGVTRYYEKMFANILHTARPSLQCYKVNAIINSGDQRTAKDDAPPPNVAETARTISWDSVNSPRRRQRDSGILSMSKLDAELRNRESLQKGRALLLASRRNKDVPVPLALPQKLDVNMWKARENIDWEGRLTRIKTVIAGTLYGDDDDDDDDGEEEEQDGTRAGDGDEDEDVENANEVDAESSTPATAGTRPNSALAKVFRERKFLASVPGWEPGDLQALRSRTDFARRKRAAKAGGVAAVQRRVQLVVAEGGDVGGEGRKGGGEKGGRGGAGERESKWPGGGGRGEARPGNGTKASGRQTAASAPPLPPPPQRQRTERKRPQSANSLRWQKSKSRRGRRIVKVAEETGKVLKMQIVGLLRAEQQEAEAFLKSMGALGLVSGFQVTKGGVSASRSAQVFLRVVGETTAKHLITLHERKRMRSHGRFMAAEVLRLDVRPPRARIRPASAGGRSRGAMRGSGARTAGVGGSAAMRFYTS